MSSSIEKKNNISRCGWVSPSNIALVKYWGKYGNQLPKNPSVSFTLSTAATTTYVTLGDAHNTGVAKISFTFDGKENKAFQTRLEKFLNQIGPEHLPFVLQYHLQIESSNSFPHSSGIASSASSMSALALCLCDLAYQMDGLEIYDDAFFRKVSILSRLGSGSACRSVFDSMAVWGKHDDISGSSDEYAVSVADEIHPVFKTFRNDILIISANEKSVSSSAGHQLMDGNPFAAARYAQANNRISTIMTALKHGDLQSFGKIMEDEALTLHALMMCSDPSYILMEEGSLSVIKKVKQFRAETKLPLYFTLDAGPNVHLLYPAEYETEISAFIFDELSQFCHDGRIIRDKVGNGPNKIL